MEGKEDVDEENWVERMEVWASFVWCDGETQENQRLLVKLQS